MRVTAYLATILSALAIGVTAPAIAADTGQGAAGSGSAAAWDLESLRELDDDNSVIRDRHGMTAEQLEDMDVVDTAGERIGEIEEVLVGADNRIVAVTVDTGGFFADDKELIMDLDQLELQGDRFATTMSSDQLQQLPEWKD